jgi:hypothetical protein
VIGRREEDSKVGRAREKLAFFDFYFQGVNYMFAFMTRPLFASQAPIANRDLFSCSPLIYINAATEKRERQTSN